MFILDELPLDTHDSGLHSGDVLVWVGDNYWDVASARVLQHNT